MSLICNTRKMYGMYAAYSQSAEVLVTGQMTGRESILGRDTNM